MIQSNKQHRKAGFTLMETLLAVALVGMLISIFITVFVPVRGMIQQALAKQDADRVVSTLRAELNTLRANERSNGSGSSANSYTSAFDKGFYWLRGSKNPATSIVIFSYRADTTKGRRADGTYPPIPANRVKAGKDNQLTTVVCPMNSNLHRSDLQHAVGTVYLVKLSQILPDNERYRVSTSPGSIDGASSPESYFSKDETNPWGGFIMCRADFYIMYPVNPERYRGRTWSRVGRPVFSANISFRR